MAKLSEVVRFLEKELGAERVPDYPGAYNGLQLQNGGEVRRVACAVDASQPVIEKAVAEGADLLVVHHGMFWQGVRMLTGSAYSKLKIAMDAGLAIYSSHIPLDIHR
jgi:putative NIF3 family GTP cyclohydrolase 1 type 2